MREIKFRAYDKRLQMMRKANYIDFANKEVMFYADDYGEEDYAQSLDIARDFSEVELMQYTGLKDKDGVEIYEGDVLLDEYLDESGTVVFRDGGFYLVFYDGVISELQEHNVDCMVIDNIYEQPELLERED